MSQKYSLSNRDRELMKLLEGYEEARQHGKSFYIDAEDCADLADWCAVGQKYDLAKEIAQYGLSLHPGNTSLLVELAYLHLDTDDDAYAQEIVEQIVEETSEVIVLKASLLLRNEEVEEADRLLERVEDKDDLSNITEIAYAYMDAGYLEKVEEWLKRGEALYADDESFLKLMADYSLETSDAERAADYFNRLIDKNPYSPHYWYGLAVCYKRMSQIDKAIDACDYAIVTDDEYGEAYMLRSDLYLELDNPEQSIKDLLMACNFPPVCDHKGMALSCMGTIFLAYKKYEKAIEAFQEAARDLQETAQDELATDLLMETYANMAHAYFFLRNKEMAHHYCQQALAINDRNSYVLLLQGTLYRMDGEEEKGYNAWERALRFDPTADTWYNIGLDCITLGDVQGARQALEKAYSLHLDDGGTIERLALLSLLMGDRRKFVKYNKLCTNPLPDDVWHSFMQSLEGVDVSAHLAEIVDNYFLLGKDNANWDLSE